MRKIFVAVNCIPVDVEPAVQKFWNELDRALKKSGSALLVLTTANFIYSETQSIRVPYLLTDLKKIKTTVSAGTTPSAPMVDDIKKWYGISQEDALETFGAVHGFFASLFDRVRPAGFIGWQSVNPMTRIARACALEQDVPFWSAERGWLPRTIMFDQRENNYLSELRTSFPLQKLQRSYMPSSTIRQAVTLRFGSQPASGRYKEADHLSSRAFREKYGIPEDVKLYAYFPHGEPSINALGQTTLAQAHDGTQEELTRNFAELRDELLRRGAWLVVQEHPFNRGSVGTVDIGSDSRVIKVNEAIRSVIHAADHFIFTLSTIQFQVAIAKKSFGLLCKSALYRPDTVPLVSNFSAIDYFIDAIENESEWTARFEKIERFICFLYEYFLYDLDTEELQRSVEHVASHLLSLCSNNKNIKN